MKIYGKVWENNSFHDGEVTTTGNGSGGIGISVSKNSGITISDFTNYIIIPGFADVHTHLREPGFFYKETIKSATLAAAKGGYTAVCSMPNIMPPPDSVEGLTVQTDIIDKDAVIPVYPTGTITKGQLGSGELSDMEKIAPYVIGFTDDGRGVQSDELMEKAMIVAKSLNKPIIAHCEDNTLIKGGYIHDGSYAEENGHKGISSESEWAQVERDILLAEKTGCQYHICHISTKETVELVRAAKARGVNITCETAPHYLTLTQDDLQEDGRFKMNPPLRAKEDRKALIAGAVDGTIDMIATDHAPHSEEEKSKGLAGSAMGIVGLETAFAVLYTGLVKTGELTLERLIEMMSIAPRKVFSLPMDSDTMGITIIDLNKEYTINPEEFLSKGRATPFAGRVVSGEVVTTIVGGRVVWQK